MKRFLVWSTACLIAAAFVHTAPARADISFGYEARYAGLAGAGIAIVDMPNQACTVNPAALSLRQKGFEVQWPNVSFRWRGAGIGEAVGRLATGSVSSSDVVSLFQDFGEDAGRVDAGLGLGGAFRSVDVRVQASAALNIKPRAGFDSNNVPQTWFDGQSAATVAPSVGIGFRVPNSLLGRYNLGDVRAGVRVKPTQVYYNHYLVKPDATASSGFKSDAVAGENGQKDSTLGVDFGALWQPAFIPYTTVGLTVDNLVEPSFKVPGTDSKLMPRTVNLGASMSIPGGFLLAADLLDVTNANTHNDNGGRQFRAGAEFRPGLPILKWFAVRGGYNSETGFAAGLSIGSFGIAYAKHAPLVASETFNF